ncbi:SIMPL domain-containing protein [Entomomonas moraniae]|nr:SIMPL domain-containing protein [Entomomonas moraniae]
MMKKTLLVAALTCCLFTTPHLFAQQATDSNFIEVNKLKYGTELIAVGNINVSLSETISLKPDTVEFSISYLTEGKTPTEASDTNTKNMKALMTYLQQLNIKEQDITTVGYKNYEQLSPEPITSPANQKYQTLITIQAKIPSDQLYAVIKTLDQQGINNLDKVKDTDNTYSFAIKQVADNADTTKQQAEKKYQLIAEQLKAQGINQLIIDKYNNQPVSQSTNNIKTYYVENTIKINTKQFDQLGKIIAKAEELKMTINNDFQYSVSDNTKNKAIADAETKLLAKLQEKARRSLSSADYQLGAPQNLSVFNTEINAPIYPINRYAKNDGIMLGAVANSPEQISIQPPSQYDLTVTMNGNFDILKKISK